MGGYANFANNLYSWAVKARLLFPEAKQIPLYEKEIQTSDNGKRHISYRWPVPSKRGVLNPSSIDDSDPGQSLAQNWSLSIPNDGIFTKRALSNSIASFGQGLLQCPDGLEEGKCIWDAPKSSGIDTCKSPSLACE